jgi:hypothetical protein
VSRTDQGVAQRWTDADQDPLAAGPPRCGGVVSDVEPLCHRRIGLWAGPTTVPVADCEPGAEVQVDFSRLGLLTDVADGHRRVLHGLIFTAVCSRHMFVWPTYRQTLADVIAGFEAAW